MASGGDGFGPKVVWRFKLRQHGPSHLNKSPVLPFGHTILLRGVCSGILMFNPLITKEIIQGVVFELGAIVTSYNQHGNIVLPLNQVDEVNKSPLSFTLQLEEINPRVSRKVVNNHQTIFLPTKTCMRWRTK